MVVHETMVALQDSNSHGQSVLFQEAVTIQGRDYCSKKYQSWARSTAPRSSNISYCRFLAEVQKNGHSCELVSGNFRRIVGSRLLKTHRSEGLIFVESAEAKMSSQGQVMEFWRVDFQLWSPLQMAEELWFQQDGATCHTARATIDLLKDTFGDRLISRFGPVNWPPRSCDLTPLDYFLWDFVKSLVYADRPQMLDHLEDNIRRVIADIRPQMLENVIENGTSRLDFIRASRGSHMPEIIFKM
ncbi:putative LOC100569746 [Trichonephila clavipes]|nr:putative LOC100569746 [Trichonephila clavipes]